MSGIWNQRRRLQRPEWGAFPTGSNRPRCGHSRGPGGLPKAAVDCFKAQRNIAQPNSQLLPLVFEVVAAARRRADGRFGKGQASAVGSLGPHRRKRGPMHLASTTVMRIRF